jgi:hypothetical protein
MLKYSVHIMHERWLRKGFKVAFMMNKYEMINFCKNYSWKIKIIIFPKNLCEIQVRTLYLIKYGI